MEIVCFFLIYFILFIYDAVATHYNLFPERVSIIESKFITDSLTNTLLLLTNL